MERRPVAAVRLLLTVLCLGGPCAAAEDPPEKPNVVLFFLDDLGYGELGCQGNPEIPTPHIDSLARTGVRCTDGYVTAYYCSPSRAGLLTGRYQSRFGYETNPVGKRNLDPRAGLPLSERTLAAELQAAGYVTGLVGKWHLGGTEACHPLRRGFDSFYGFLHEGHFYVPPPYEGVTSFLRVKTLPEGAGPRMVDGNRILSTHMGHNEPPYDADNPVLRGTEPLVEPLYLTDAFTREATAFLERNRSQPFFLYLAYNAVHSPLQGATRYMERFRHIEDIHRRVFAAMLSNLDDSIGEVLEKLRALGLEEKTLVFLISDNGGPTRELTSSNAPLRGGKGNLYEGGIRVPFLVRWKGTLPEGKVYRQPVISLDVFATACAVAGIELPEERKLDGVNLLPYLAGRRDGAPHETLFWRYGRSTALRKGEWKIIGRKKVASRPAFELYHLTEDIGETTDLAAEHPEKLRELVDAWRRIESEMPEDPPDAK